ncbi:hypothetical protein Droror1_Dr00006505 [Drosera rotundifolia]
MLLRRLFHGFVSSPKPVPVPVPVPSPIPVPTMILRNFSRSRAENIRKTNPRVPPQQAAVIAQSLHDLIKLRGPFTVSNTWVHAQEVGVEGLESKTHLKLMLKWMRARGLVRLGCKQVGNGKRFFIRALPEEEGSEGGGEGEEAEGTGDRRVRKKAAKRAKKKKTTKTG